MYTLRFVSAVGKVNGHSTSPIHYTVTTCDRCGWEMWWYPNFSGPAMGGNVLPSPIHDLQRHLRSEHGIDPFEAVEI